MGWDEIKKAKERSSGGSFISLKDGDEVVGVFRGEPYAFYQIYGDKREMKSWVQGASLRFKIAFVTKENGAYVGKIFSGSKTVAEQLLDAKEEYGIDCVFKVKRKGSGKDDTRYSILFQKELNQTEIEQLNKIKLPSLTPVQSGGFDDTTPSDEPPEWATDGPEEF